MPNRILRESINESRGLGDCSFFAQDLYKRLITYADDYGRFNSDPQIMLARLYPMELDVVTNEDLIDALTELVGIRKIAFYTGTSIHEDKMYGCFPNWSEHQRIRNSKKKYPDPTDTRVNDWYLRRFIPISMKIELLQRDNFSCTECGKRITETDNARALVKLGAGLFHIDHIVPVNQGGRATMENLRILCPRCNLSRKKYYSFEEILHFAENCGNSPRVAANCSGLRPESNPIQLQNPTIESNNESNTQDDVDLLLIQNDHNEILNAAQSAGFPNNQATWDRIIDLYAQYGKDIVLQGIMACVDQGKTTIAYLKGCCQNNIKGNSKPAAGSKKNPFAELREVKNDDQR